MEKIQKTIKLSSDIYKAAESWIDKSGSVFNFSTLAEAAIRKFITEPQTYEPVVLGHEKAMDIAKKVMKKHKTALDRMK